MIFLSPLPALFTILPAAVPADGVPTQAPLEPLATASSALAQVLGMPNHFSIPGVILHATQTSNADGLGPLSGHGDLLVLGAAVLVAGAGAVTYLLRRRHTKEPADGVVRTESQRATLQQVRELEKKLLLPNAKVRHQSVFALINLLRQLAPPDRPDRIRRIARQLCLDWPLINKNAQWGHPIKNQIPRMVGPLRQQLIEALEEEAKHTKVINTSPNASAILNWIRTGK
jgi:hypothetical protein